MKPAQLFVLFIALSVSIVGCTQNPVGPVESNSTSFSVETAKAEVNAACWGQASAVFAQMGAMGEHSSQQANPRLGLRNLAKALYAQGVIPDDSMASLGAFVATELGLTIEACE